MNIAEEFQKKFGLGLERPFNDYSYGRSQDMVYNLSRIKEMDGKKFKRIVGFASKHRGNGDESLLLLRARLLYMEKKYGDALECFMELASSNPLDINRWIDLAFGLLHAKKYYDLGLDLLFNFYGYIHYCLKLNVQTINIPNLLLIQRAMKGAKEYDNKYLFPVKFGEEFLLLSRECNNNCIACPNGTKDRLAVDCGVPAYLQKKIGSPDVKRLVFTGGEPTILPDFFGILQSIFRIRPDIKLMIQTNGRAFSDPAFIGRFEDFRNKHVGFEVSVFSHGPKIHDRITRCTGSFTQTASGIGNLLERGYAVELDVPICRLNAKELPKTVEHFTNNYPSLSRINLVLPAQSGNYLAYFGKESATLRASAVRLLRKYSGSVPLELRDYNLYGDMPLR